MFIAELVTLALLVAFVYLAISVWKVMTYWKVRGVKHRTPLPLVGNMFRALRCDRHFFHLYGKIYHAFPEEKMVGMVEFMTPTLILRDTELIERVLIREFSTYSDRGPFAFEPSSVLYHSVFNMAGNRWRMLRRQLLPTFTTGKLRSAFPIVSVSIQEFLKSNPKMLTRDLISKLAMKIILRSMFGIELLGAGEDEMSRNVKAMVDATVVRMVQQVGLIFFPKLADFLHFKFMPRYLDDYFRSLFNTVLTQRAARSLDREDLAEILIQMRKAEKLKVYNEEGGKEEILDITDEMTHSQALFFFFAGLEPTALLILHAAFDLAQWKDCQDKAREEVRNVLQKYGKHSWESVRDMKYLHCCIKESLRLHPSLQFLTRVNNKDTELGGVKIKKGTRIVIPTHSMQMDSKYFPDPEKYKPERFMEEIGDKFSYLPFSEGPRICLGKRFAIMETATFLTQLLENFELSLSPETKLPVKYETKLLFLTPKWNNEIKINLSKIS